MNSLLYPTDYPNEVSAAADQASFALENAVTLLQVQARDTAIANSHTRRIAGQNVIATNNRLGVSKAILMPLSQIGAKTVPSIQLQGTVAHMAGGRSYGGFTNQGTGYYFSNESAFVEGMQLSELRVYPATIFNRVAGYWLGGLGNKPIRAIDKLSYPLNATRRMSVELAENRVGGAGVGDSTIGAILGGTVPTVDASLRSMDIYTYATESDQPLQNALQDPRFAAHGGTSSGSTGAIYGGCSKGWMIAGNGMTSIDLFNFSTRALTRSTGVLSTEHFAHACFGEKTRGVIAGGGTNTSAFSYITDFLSQYVYSTQGAALLGARLAEAKVCCDGGGSSVGGYVLGGDNAASIQAGWASCKSIDKFTFAINATSRIDSALPNPTSDQGCTSDYAATLYS